MPAENGSLEFSVDAPIWSPVGVLDRRNPKWINPLTVPLIDHACRVTYEALWSWAGCEGRGVLDLRGSTSSGVHRSNNLRPSYRSVSVPYPINSRLRLRLLETLDRTTGSGILEQKRFVLSNRCMQGHETSRDARDVDASNRSGSGRAKPPSLKSVSGLLEHASASHATHPPLGRGYASRRLGTGSAPGREVS